MHRDLLPPPRTGRADCAAQILRMPASGSPENSRLGHTQRVQHLGRLRLRPHQLHQATISGPPLSQRPLGPLLNLSASSRRRSETLVRCGAFAQAVLLSYWRKHVSGQAPSLHGHCPASRLLWACPTPERAAHEVMSSSAALRLGPHPNGPPRFLGQSFGARCPLSPRGARHLHAPVAHLSILGFTIPGRLAAPKSLTRPNRVRFRYGSRLRLARLRQIGLLRPTLAWLLVKRAIYKVSSFQLTRLTRLDLAHQDK